MALTLDMQQSPHHRSIRTRWASRSKTLHFERFSKRARLNACKNFILWCYVLLLVEKSFRGAKFGPLQFEFAFTKELPHTLLTPSHRISFARSSSLRVIWHRFSMTPRRTAADRHHRIEGFLFLPTVKWTVLRKLFHKCSVEIFLEHTTELFLKTFQNESFLNALCI